MTVRIFSRLAILFCLGFVCTSLEAQKQKPAFNYSVSFPDPESHSYQVSLVIADWENDSLVLKMPNWMPGYYQLMNYADNLENLMVTIGDGQAHETQLTNGNTLIITNASGRKVSVSYKVNTTRKFVATSYVDGEHAYLVPGNSFFYPESYYGDVIQVAFDKPSDWSFATGLAPVMGAASNLFSAENFDVLFDSPILLGKLEQFPSFEVGGVPHRFLAWQPGEFDQRSFMNDLQKVVASSVDIIRDIPFDEYTFIGIGPGRGGIEHLNNTTVSFSGEQLENPEARTRMLSFLAHEYFHHYNVKRIRPYELGPFDYDNGSRSDLIWLSEGVTVYYESIILRRAGLINQDEFLRRISQQLTTLENDSGRFHQSLAQASYYTWEDGPFGAGQGQADRAISIYNKGAVIGFLLDLSIRNASANKKSLDDVMRKLYYHYYKEQGRGFTTAEFQRVCEEMAGQPLAGLFEYVFTTREIDYEKILSPAGLELGRKEEDGKVTLELRIAGVPTGAQSDMLKSWAGE